MNFLHVDTVEAIRLAAQDSRGADIELDMIDPETGRFVSWVGF